MKKLVNANLQSFEEFLKRMIDGERFLFGLNEYFYEAGSGFKSIRHGQHLTKLSMDVTELADTQLDQFMVEVDAPWYENIPDGGVLCWSSNLNATAKISPSIVLGYDSDRKVFMSVFGTKWKYATPVKPEECFQESSND